MFWCSQYRGVRMKFVLGMIALDRRLKTLFLTVADVVLSVFAALLTIRITDGGMAVEAMLAIAVIAGGLSVTTGTARMMLRAFVIDDVMRIGVFAGLVGIAFFVIGLLSSAPFTATTALLMSAVLLCLAVLVRVVAAAFFAWARGQDEGRERVVIYGAGAAGQQLRGLLRSADEMTAVAFIDDNPSLHGAMIGGLRVRAASEIDAVIRRSGATQVLLAMPSLSPERRTKVLTKLRDVNATVKALPSYLDLIQSKNMLGALRSVEPDELLGRDAVDFDLPEMRECYFGQSVLVSGAGGSIGSELCRQVMETAPKRLVLFELTEFALYSIEMELKKHRNAASVEIVAVLGSVCDRVLATRVLRENDVDIILHAAAYKHVPLVEDNPLAAAQNNVLGTQAMALAAQDADVKRFVLVSTDKAVRPTNVMGATKRLAELVIQDLQSRSKGTIFSMVRFGNVLGSSGSVIPLFKKQIREGGPITVTHPEVTRFFMTIPEAARLVLLAGSFAQGGEVFVLDMGQPVKIADLARRLIEISGLTVKDANNPSGDIEITYVGLRPGEKLYEELLIDDNTISTPHQKIMRAMEGSRSELEVASAVRRIQAGLQTSDQSVVRPVLAAMVDGYRIPQQHSDTMLPAIAEN